jgi:hypothetical protein
MMTRRHNQNWVARIGQPRYRDLPFIPLREKSEKFERCRGTAGDKGGLNNDRAA